MFNEAFANLLVAVIFIKLMRSDSFSLLESSIWSALFIAGEALCGLEKLLAYPLIHVTIPR